MSGQVPPTGQPGQPGSMPGGGHIPPGAAQQGQPSEEEVRQYLSQMRGAPVEQIVAEVLSALLNGAQVKLGRNDARLLIDLAGTLAEQARAHLSDDVISQVEDALSKLRLSQVEAEKELAGAGADGEDAPEPNDLTETPPEPTAERAASQAEAAESSAEAPSQSPSPGSKLWTPGQ